MISPKPPRPLKRKPALPWFGAPVDRARLVVCASTVVSTPVSAYLPVHGSIAQRTPTKAVQACWLQLIGSPERLLHLDEPSAQPDSF